MIQTGDSDGPADARYWLVSGSRRLMLAEGANDIGRDPRASVWLDSPQASRRHARITIADDAATLEDLGSKNRTLVNDRPVTEPTQLSDGDAIQIGAAVFVFRVTNSHGEHRDGGEQRHELAMRESLTPGTRLGRYDIVALMDAGGMGEVYRAHDAELGRAVAIKILPAAFADHPDRLRRFELEARAAAALNHPNILAVYDVGRHDGTPYIVSELLEGQSLRARLDGAALPLRTAIEFGIQIAEGLAAAHDKGIVHRDLKPENMFVTRDERIKILDFGLAKLVDLDSVTLTAAPHTSAGVVLGTVGYLSPEQASGLPADHRSDIFSVGAILFEMVTHRRAFARATAAQTLTAVLEDDPTASIAVGAGPSARVMNLVRRCLDKSPERRFQSARDLALVLGNELTGDSLSECIGGLVRRHRCVQRSGCTAPRCAPHGVSPLLRLSEWEWRWHGHGYGTHRQSSARKYGLMSSHHQHSIRMHCCRSPFRQMGRNLSLSHQWTAPTGSG